MMMRRKTQAGRVPIRAEQDIERMRRAGHVVAMVLKKIGGAIRPGITTREIDGIAEQTIRLMEAQPAFLGYRGYPATACVSINDEVVHGIPGSRVLREGDIVSIDLGAIVEGWYGDAAYTFPVGTVSELAERLMQAGKESLAAGINAAQAGKHIRDIGIAVQQVALANGFTVVRDLCGHGIGQRLHEEPQVPNYPTVGGNVELRPGMTLAIEPMINAGRAEVKLEPDQWTFVTADGTLSVHYEHTVLIREEGPEILTSLK